MSSLAPQDLGPWPYDTIPRVKRVNARKSYTGTWRTARYPDERGAVEICVLVGSGRIALRPEPDSKEWFRVETLPSVLPGSTP